MSITKALQKATTEGLNQLYGNNFIDSDYQVNETRPEFEGDYTVVLFSLLKKTARTPDALGKELGNKLLENYPQLFRSFNIIKGFLNIEINPQYWFDHLQQHYHDVCYGKLPLNQKKGDGGIFIAQYQQAFASWTSPK
jgi:arginyl-tRNA synthetase